MKSILFLFLCLGLRNTTGQPTKATEEKPTDTQLSQMADGARVLYMSYVFKGVYNSGHAYDAYADCLTLFGQKGLLYKMKMFDKDVIPMEQACKVIALMTEIVMAAPAQQTQSTEGMIKALGNFYRYFDENKDGELSSAEALVPMGLIKALGFPMEDIFGISKLESMRIGESVSIEGNHFEIQ